MEGVVILVLFNVVLILAAHRHGFGRGYDRAWRDVAEAARKAELENHRWPAPPPGMRRIDDPK